MSSISGKQLAKRLERNGWTLLRIRGSHHIYGKPNSPLRLSIPIHGNKPLKIGLLRNLLKIAELSEYNQVESNVTEEASIEELDNETNQD